MVFKYIFSLVLHLFLGKNHVIRKLWSIWCLCPKPFWSGQLWGKVHGTQFNYVLCGGGELIPLLERNMIAWQDPIRLLEHNWIMWRHTIWLCPHLKLPTERNRIAFHVTFCHVRTQLNCVMGIWKTLAENNYSILKAFSFQKCLWTNSTQTWMRRSFVKYCNKNLW